MNSRRSPGTRPPRVPPAPAGAGAVRGPPAAHGGGHGPRLRWLPGPRCGLVLRAALVALVALAGVALGRELPGRRLQSGFGDGKLLAMMKAAMPDLQGAAAARPVIGAVPPPAGGAQPQQVPYGPGGSASASAAAVAASNTFPRDDVALAAAKALASGTGGINVVSTSPIALSNPVDIYGGNYNARANAAGAAGRR
ncbi:hypothetical protein HYH03_013108 [Edaphochlamys debaryana]|uniref:Uncharacterized protein n=1 Tax=Edaphochlamys debaryana TaxID=47281 RepID=A0A835XRG5_9CHLO|nr:hypothetical protein HYH03_013108 [Edaphochlamys debaryana]|eukprot:KAG2488257.1 hypothetical protein HYH03_013108 [Edaphochlamys debaryana]